MDHCVRGELSVRETERLVRDVLQVAKSPSGPEGAEPEGAPRPTWIVAVERRVQDALATKVRIEVEGNERGEIRISFFNKPDLNRLLDRIAPQPGLE
jgi:hypothetical protein